MLTPEDLSRFQGSKYVQSRIGESYQQATSFSSRADWFCSAVRLSDQRVTALLRKGQSCVPDIVCHGVPSRVWQKYVAYRKPCIVASTENRFRRKNSGWSDSPSSPLKMIRSISLLKSRSLYEGILKKRLPGPRCHACHFKGINRSDITLADRGRSFCRDG